MRNTQKIRFTNKSVDSIKSPLNMESREYSDMTAVGLKLIVYKSGRKMFFYRYTYKGKKEAIKIGEYPAILVDEARTTAFEYRGQVDRGGNPKADVMKRLEVPDFADFARNTYLPYAAKTKRSHASDESKIRLHFIPRFGKYRLDEIGAKGIEDYHHIIKDSHCAATANRHLMQLSKMFSLAVQWEIIDRNPCATIKQFKENNKSTVYLSQEEIGRLLAAMEHDPNKIAVAALKTMLFTGMRREEVLQAKWIDLNVEQGNLHLPMTKSGKSRFVPLSEAAIKILSALNTQAYSPYIFPGRDVKKPLNNPRKCFSRVLNAAKIGHIRIHDLRHTFCSHAAMSGVPLYHIQTMVGHASSQTTMRYAHLNNDSLRAASGLVANVFEGAKK
jgi:integrase